MVSFKGSRSGGLARTDFAVGDSTSRHFVLVEFENAVENSVFKIKNRDAKKLIPEWSARFEHGFSQLVDWTWIMTESRQAPVIKAAFRGEVKGWTLLLVAGRKGKISSQELERLEWRTAHAAVQGRKVHHVTFDELYEDLRARAHQAPLV
ncbi:MAG: DUF4263 domain-containing protein [Deltaproteobacteria bacterium]|nr:DUF4263 domain-containing protein [Deltaproteobacteria bacterium]